MPPAETIAIPGKGDENTKTQFETKKETEVKSEQPKSKSSKKDEKIDLSKDPNVSGAVKNNNPRD